MENFLEILIQHGGDIVTAILVVVFAIFGKPKTAEQIKAIKEKKAQKLDEKAVKQIEKAKQTALKAEEIKKEINKNA